MNKLTEDYLIENTKLHHFNDKWVFNYKIYGTETQFSIVKRGELFICVLWQDRFNGAWRNRIMLGLFDSVEDLELTFKHVTRERI